MLPPGTVFLTSMPYLIPAKSKEKNKTTGLLFIAAIAKSNQIELHCPKETALSLKILWKTESFENSSSQKIQVVFFLTLEFFQMLLFNLEDSNVCMSTTINVCSTCEWFHEFMLLPITRLHIMLNWIMMTHSFSDDVSISSQLLNLLRFFRVSHVWV